MSYGKRLIPVLIDEAARDTPDKVYASIPRSDDLSEGFEDITYKRFANAINRVAAWLDSALGGRGTTGAFAYAGPKDLRYTIITVAAVKSGREVRGTGPRLDRVVGAAADTGSQIVLPSPFAALEGQLQVLDSTKCNTYLCPVSTVPIIGEARAERPGMQLLVVPGCEEWLNEEAVGDYRYGKTFEEAKEDTFMIAHTSGTTGLPKPIRYTNGSVATFDAQQNLPDPEGELWWHLIVGSRMFCPMPTLHIVGMIFSLLIPTFFAVVAVFGPGDTPVSVETAEQLHRYGHVDGILYPPSLLEDFCRSSASFESLEKLRYIFYAGSPLENPAGEVLSKVTKLVNLIGTTECGVFPVFQQSSPKWSCFRFHSFLDYQMESRHSGTFELVLTQTDRSKECSTTFHHYPHLQEFRTKDLYVKHPTKEDLWIYRGRTDDLIILSHGQILDPTTMEAMINGHPHVRSAIIGGDGRARPFLLVEQTIDSRSPGHDGTTRLDDIWPVVEEANGLCSEYVRLTRPLVILSSPEKPFERLANGSVNRRGTLRVYQHEIDAAYNKLDPKKG